MPCVALPPCLGALSQVAICSRPLLLHPRRRSNTTKGVTEKYYSRDEKRGTTFFGWRSEPTSQEAEFTTSKPRPTRIFAFIYNSFGASLAFVLTLESLRKLLVEFCLDGGKLRFVLVVVFPFFVLRIAGVSFSLPLPLLSLIGPGMLSYNFIITLIAQVIGPVV